MFDRLLEVYLLNRQSQKGARYLILYGALKSLILQQVIQGGERLPSTRSLSENLHLSRNTVNRAFELLCDDGYLVNKAGSGFYVNAKLHAEIIKSAKTDKKTADPEFKLSKSAQRLPIKPVLKTADKIMPTFGLTAPPSEIFPHDIWARLQSRRWRLSHKKLYNEADPMGYLALRRGILDYLVKNRGLDCHEDQIMITSGSQQGLDLSLRVLMDVGQNVALSDPCYDGICNLLEHAGIKAHYCAFDDQGIDVKGLGEKKIDCFLLTPSRQYPLGIVMSLERRLQVLEMARQKTAWIIEDDYDSELRFEGQPVSALQGLGQQENVIYAGTFSRTLFPALRLGFLVIPERLVPYFVQQKRLLDGQTSILPQAVLADFISEGHYHRHIRKSKKLYQERRDILVHGLKTSYSGLLTPMQCDGGLHLCVKLNDEISDIEFSRIAAKENLGLRPLSPFYRATSPQNGLVFNFASYNEGQIQNGLKGLDKILFK